MKAFIGAVLEESSYRNAFDQKHNGTAHAQIVTFYATIPGLASTLGF